MSKRRSDKENLTEPGITRNGKLKIPLAFEDALKAATETPVPDDRRRKRSGEKRS